MSLPWIQQKYLYVPGVLNVTRDAFGSGTAGEPAVTGVPRKPLPWFLPS